MKNKTLIIIIIVALIVGYFVFFKPKAVQAQSTIPFQDFGKTASGRQITEEMIQREVNIIMNDPSWFASVKKTANEKGVEVNQALRDAAIWQLKTHH